MTDHRDPLRISKVLDAHTSRLGMGHAGDVAKLFACWDEAVGPAVAAHVQPLSLRNGTLKLRVDTPTWATEIGYLREKIRGQVNEALGRVAVTKVDVTVGPLQATPRSLGRLEDPRSRAAGGRPGDASDGDPLEAFERARAAWFRRRRKGR